MKLLVSYYIYLLCRLYHYYFDNKWYLPATNKSIGRWIVLYNSVNNPMHYGVKKPDDIGVIGHNHMFSLRPQWKKINWKPIQFQTKIMEWNSSHYAFHIPAQFIPTQTNTFFKLIQIKDFFIPTQIKTFFIPLHDKTNASQSQAFWTKTAQLSGNNCNARHFVITRGLGPDSI